MGIHFNGIVWYSFCSFQVEKALANAVLKTAEMVCVKEQEPVPQTPVAPAETNSALKGVSQSLLERVGHLPV
jgi:hypothetical protein